VSGARTINSIAFVVGVAIIAFVLAAGFSHFEPANLVLSFFPFGSAGAFRAAAIVYWSYTGSTRWPP
jgi:APA family basic amino acid/polyamine antiporter/cationic amino acid transporter 4